MSTRTVKKAEDFFRELLQDKKLPSKIRDHIKTEMQKVGPKEAILDKLIADVRNSSLSVLQRKQALTTILEFYRGEI